VKETVHSDAEQYPRVTIIGCGTPTPTPDRFGSCYLVDLPGERLLFDCGPAATWKLVRAGVSPTEIDTVIFTHHHFDHDADFPTFILSRWDQLTPTDRTLHVYGPAPTVAYTHGIIDADAGLFAHDWQARVGHPLSQATYADRGGVLPRAQPDVAARDIGPGPVLSGGTWQMRAARAVHVQPYLESLAYRIDADGGSVVLTGDTAPCPEVTELARGADVLIMMCWESDDRVAGTAHASGCSSIEDAATTAAEAGVACW
jgi:ribonuclease Z